MSTVHTLRHAAFVAVFCLATSASAFEGQPGLVSDITLASGGILTGQLLNSQGKAIANQAVYVLHNEKRVAKTLTDQRGRFRVRSLRGGAHILKTGEAKQACRFWTTKAAPPSARKTVLLVADKNVTLGQTPAQGPLVYGGSLGNGAGGGFLSNSGMWLGTGIVTSAAVMGGVIGFNSALDRRPASP